ncbi:MAG: hypothetical protein HYV09_01215 [Deltaproteobacteria bacterium]|nr:hypothetical protein [Deltaproteobacteria bacterium]
MDGRRTGGSSGGTSITRAAGFWVGTFEIGGTDSTFGPGLGTSGLVEGVDAWAGGVACIGGGARLATFSR